MKSKVQKKLTDEAGFTLVEVLASLTILSIILVGVFNLFIFTNEAAVSNNDRLVAISLGQATMERLKLDPNAYFDNSSKNRELNKDSTIYSGEQCKNLPDVTQQIQSNCESLFEVLVNDRLYHIFLDISQSASEKELKLIDVVITVELQEENIKHQVEGYVNYVD